MQVRFLPSRLVAFGCLPRYRLRAQTAMVARVCCCNSIGQSSRLINGLLRVRVPSAVPLHNGLQRIDRPALAMLGNVQASRLGMVAER